MAPRALPCVQPIAAYQVLAAARVRAGDEAFASSGLTTTPTRLPSVALANAGVQPSLRWCPTRDSEWGRKRAVQGFAVTGSNPRDVV